MKKLVVIVLLVILTGCEKYVSGTQLSLSGKYLITRVSMVSVDQNTTRDTVYYSGDVYKSQNTLTPKPFSPYKSNPKLTPNLVAIILVMRCFNSGILMLSITSLEKAYINKAFASFWGIPRCCM